MDRFDYDFELTDENGSSYSYKCGKINARLDFLENNLVRMAVFEKESDLLPTFSVCPDNKLSKTGRERLSTDGFSNFSPVFKRENGFDIFSLSSSLSLKLEKHNFLLSAIKDGKTIFSERKPMAQNFGGEYGEGVYHYLEREENEKIYGLGDKCGELNKAGRVFRIDSADSMGFDAKQTDPLYKHIPFYICESSYSSFGIFYDTSCNSTVDLGAEVDNYYGPYKYFKTEDSVLVFYLIFGTKKEILQTFAKMCGKAILPPKWSFSYCASTMAYTDAKDAGKEMQGFLDTLEKQQFECKGFYLSSGYTSIGNRRYVFNWNKDKFPNPKAFVDSYKDKGIHLIPNIKPAFLTDHPMYETIAKNGWFIHYANQKPAIIRFWDGFGSYLDFTNPGAFNFWKEQVTDKLLKYGIDCTWNDNNEFGIREKDCLAYGFGDGEVQAYKIRPILTYLMSLASYEAQVEYNGKNRPFLSSRSGNSGIRRLAQTWSGDNRTDFKDLRYCHNIGLTLSLSGLYFYGHDLGGFSGNMPSRELLLRWLQHGVFEPRFTIHSWNKDGSATMPWTYHDIVDSVRKLFAQRKRFVPYLYDASYRACKENLPINSPLFLYFDDVECKNEIDAFMFGQKILAVPIFDEGKTETEVYLPKTNDYWFLGDSDKKYMASSSVTVQVPATENSVYFVKAGSVIAFDESSYYSNEEEKLVFHVYPYEKGSFKDSFFTDDGKTYDYKNNKCVLLDFEVSCDKEKIVLNWTNRGSMSIEPKFVLCQGDKRKLICTEKRG